MDLEIREFEEKLVATINEAHMPLELVRLVLNDVQNKVAAAAEESIKKQMEEKLANEQKKEGSENK